MNNHRLLVILLVVTSLFGYLEWGGGQSIFLAEAELEIIIKLFTDPMSVVHPFAILPMVGQVLLVLTFFQNKPGRTLTFIGLGCISLLLTFVLFVGFISLNIKIIMSVLPFHFVGIWVVWWRLKKKGNKSASQHAFVAAAT